MKKVIVILSFLMSSAALVAQNRYHEAPQRVRESFNRDYPNAQKAHWGMSGSEWTVNFDNRDYGNMTTHYSRNGERIDARIPFTKRDVPDPVKNSVDKRYPHSRNQEYTKIVRHGNQSEGFYKVSLRNHGKDMVVYMDADGHRRNYYDRH